MKDDDFQKKILGHLRSASYEKNNDLISYDIRFTMDELRACICKRDKTKSVKDTQGIVHLIADLFRVYKHETKHLENGDFGKLLLFSLLRARFRIWALHFTRV